MVRVVAEDFTDSGQDLIDWAQDKYGKAVSYTEAEQAVKFTLYVDGAGNLIY